MAGAATTFGKYTLLDRVDVGGMAEVFLAKETGAEGFERTIAIKRILPHMAEDENFVRMFIDEAKIASGLTHPNIAQIFDLGRADDHLFIALEYIHGKDLRAIWNLHRDHDRIMPMALTCHVALKAADALHYAHFAEGAGGRPLGLIHRDVSPQNILVSYDGEVKVIDFGLAKAAGRAVQTQAGIVKGKLAYMSPEQAHGRHIDLRSDVYALGIVLWELLTGERLFYSPNDVDTVMRVRRGDVISPRHHNEEIPEDLERVVGLALQKNVDDRYQTAMELHDDLHAFVQSAGLRLTADAVGDYVRRAFPDDYARHAPAAPAVAPKRSRPRAPPPSGPTTVPEDFLPYDGPSTFEDRTPREARTVELDLEEEATTALIAPPFAPGDDDTDI